MMMKRHDKSEAIRATHVAFLLLVAGLAACGGGKTVTLPPVEPIEVEVYLPGGGFPSERYEVMRTIDIAVQPTVAYEDLLAQAVQQAAAVGADALIVDRMGPNASGFVVGVGGAQEVRRMIKARAVYYPALHPELNDDQGS